MAANQRSKPNILVTGTPGTGKTTLCELLAQQLEYQHINIGEKVKALDLHEGWDDEYGCYVIDEDKVLDELEPTMAEGGVIIDHHGCDFFPERWFDLVIVLQTDNAMLYDRLVGRGYSGKKLEDNVTCEIMQTILEEAHESYKPEVVVPLPSNTVDDMENAVNFVEEWVQRWVPHS
eukprot:Colp12_sorted_trinity150504_noHs@27217